MQQQIGTDDEGEINRRLEALVGQQEDVAAGDIALAVQRRRDAMRRAARAREGQGLTLARFSAQPEPFWSPKLHEITQLIPQKCSR
jgi:hypothetical protein